MAKIKIFSLIIILFSLQCTVDLRQIPAPSTIITTLKTKSDLPFILGKFEIMSADRGLYQDAWRIALKKNLQSNRIFSNILSDNDKPPVGDYYLLDVELRPYFEDHYNWWVTWPVIYPFTILWPFQYRFGKYEVELKYKLYKKDNLIKENSIKKEKTTNVLLYGFFKTREFERMIEEINLEMLESCTESINSAL
ncbi:hypothetical protein P3G55_16935 [Leptospira sp. 96542]|nr:hypothetical protein [Leptospira sp. 96542]